LGPKDQPYPDNSIYPADSDICDYNGVLVDLIFRGHPCFPEPNPDGKIPVYQGDELTDPVKSEADDQDECSGDDTDIRELIKHVTLLPVIL